MLNENDTSSLSFKRKLNVGKKDNQNNSQSNKIGNYSFDLN